MPEPLHTVTERLRFIAARQEGLYTMAELCERAGISRKTGYEWERRYAELGADGLKPGSHAPHTCPHRIEPRMAELLLDARRTHPHWGPRKLLPWLSRRHPELEGRLPAASTVGDLLKRHNLVPAARKRRPRVQRAGKPPAPGALNEVWAADYKGDFRTRDGKRCYPLTITDLYSRALLTCQALLSVSFAEALPHWERCFRMNGLPERIRTDNGAPFATSSALGLTRLNVFWTRLGIVHDRIERGRPDQNGSHERMHRTLKKEATLPPGDDQAGQQRRFDEWREEFVHERPHEALGQKTPGSVYQRSPREMPEKAPKPEYEGHWLVRRVRGPGTIKFKGRELFLSEVLTGEPVALEEVDDGVWSIYYYERLIGRLREETGVISG